MEKKEDKCKKCGICCHYMLGNKFKRCKFLNSDNSCRVYHTRLGRRVDSGVFCGMRDNSPFDYPGCTYNTDKPILSIYNRLVKDDKPKD